MARIHCLASAASYERAIDAWMARIAAARQQATAWRLAAIVSAVLALASGGSFAQAIATQRIAAVHVVQLRDADAGARPGRDCVVYGDIITTSARSASVDLQSAPAKLAARGSGLCFR
jgi:type IV secretory pathway TrbF-like protein